MISEEQLKWLYSLLDEPMTDFDCGKLCAPNNNGIPHCCDSVKTVPLLFKDELAFHQNQGEFWRKMDEKDPAYKNFHDLIEEDGYEIFSICPGCTKCERDKRALVCRTYPFEPFLDEDGALVGLTFNLDEKEFCPLISKEDVRYNPQYITNSMIYWDFIFQHFPDQFDIYMENSDDLRELAENGEKIRFYTPDSPEGIVL